MANIYELTNDFLQLLNMLEDEEIDEQVIMDTLESVEYEIEEKAREQKTPRKCEKEEKTEEREEK